MAHSAEDKRYLVSIVSDVSRLLSHLSKNNDDVGRISAHEHRVVPAQLIAENKDAGLRIHNANYG
jgi:hypothetical protein